LEFQLSSLKNLYTQREHIEESVADITNQSSVIPPLDLHKVTKLFASSEKHKLNPEDQHVSQTINS